MNRNWMKRMPYGITALIGLIMVLLTVELHGFDSAASMQEKMRILADAFTIPGVTILLVGVLVMISNEGIFLGITYVFSYAAKLLIPGVDKTHERYGDYIERKREKGPIHGFGFLFVVGGIYFAIAVLFTVLYYVF